MPTPHKILPLLGLLAALAATARAQRTVEVFVTAQATGQRLAPSAPLTLAPSAALTEKQQYVFVDAGKQFQSILGIGGALTDAAAETYARLPEAKRREFIKAYYDPKEGIGYSLARTSIHSCDFSSGSYTYVAENDAELKTFSIDHDRQYRLPLIKDAIATAGGKLTLFASPWSPPAWMKDNHDMLHGGKLKPEFADAWARYFVKFVQAYEAAGIPVWGLSVQNEPMAIQSWESCFFTAEEERDFVRDHLGPVLAKNGLGGRKIIAWDHNRTLMYERARVMLDDPAAAKYVWGIGFHWYVNDSYDNVRLVKEAYPKTHVMLTEACLYPWDRAKMTEWHWGESYGTALIHDFNNGAEGWTDWNILLDETGGPNHVQNFCYAPVHADTKTGELLFMNSFYYIGHFSKFIRPGARRIVSSATIDTLETTAFRNPDGSIAVVVLNTTDQDQPFNLQLDGGVAAAASPAHSIITLMVH
ncbi:glycoside hydrolase family 30 protein [Opitutus sp. GAS368]|uniref:glycoside hydrolase family 30 protein n=1 Tax=Opitutus sp. GAS368 TaxID=1882749 RepID=UPI00087D405C|nr:glycoside hydrolase family 30 protein [Opitutus sp. GAS368]SDR67819.1 glucosylceramidase [Opitutus sp. GAS368]